MCVPLMALAVGASLIGTGVSAYGAIKQGQDARAAADFNADIQRKQAIQAENVGADQAARKIQEGRKLASTQTVMAAAGGLDTGSGTTANIINETAKYSELDALRITNNAARQAWGLQTQANLEEQQGKNAQTAGFINAGASILGGASNAYFGAKAIK